MHEKVA